MESQQARAATLQCAHPIVDALISRYQTVRSWSRRLCASLQSEDYCLQAMPDASPTKWHLAHTTWFFETFLLRPYASGYEEFRPEFAVLFNSYYNAVGPRWPRSQRGLLSRPTVAEVFAYRTHVDAAMLQLLEALERDERAIGRLSPLVEIGLNHEQQHQELIVTDLKYAFSLNPLQPAFGGKTPKVGNADTNRWVPFNEQLAEIGHSGEVFAFDNESPRHQVFVRAFQLASRLTTNAEYLEFIHEGGYDRPEFWLSDGWAARQANGWAAPLYWDLSADAPTVYTTSGRWNLQPNEPVCHLSFYEADAFARWAGARLPTEAEWEIAASSEQISGHFLESEHFHPAIVAAEDDTGDLVKLFGDVWQWTASPYVGYPGFAPSAGALGEYNGKFMCNQMVLRGASCVTPRTHCRKTYRNFFPPDARWQFTGLRLAKDLK